MDARHRHPRRGVEALLSDLPSRRHRAHYPQPLCAAHGRLPVRVRMGHYGVDGDLPHERHRRQHPIRYRITREAERRRKWVDPGSDRRADHAHVGHVEQDEREAAGGARAWARSHPRHPRRHGVPRARGQLGALWRAGDGGGDGVHHVPLGARLLGVEAVPGPELGALRHARYHLPHGAALHQTARRLPDHDLLSAVNGIQERRRIKGKNKNTLGTVGTRNGTKYPWDQLSCQKMRSSHGACSSWLIHACSSSRLLVGASK
mmetsp:Transcript_5505/g.13311  ORF Transcript_5505/g.13311 Transcript_5505/m.13311 type:complete len:261 (-) Transcript_5505:127-909(-)